MKEDDVKMEPEGTCTEDKDDAAGEMRSLIDQARDHIPDLEEGKKVLVIARITSVTMANELEYLFAWRLAFSNGEELEVYTLLDSKNLLYKISEPVESWSWELYRGNDHPEQLEGDDLARWFAFFHQQEHAEGSSERHLHPPGREAGRAR